MKVKQIPVLASALAMTAGLYLLVGPFRQERDSPARSLPVWGTLLAYELLVIGAIALLRRRHVPTDALTAVSLFFLADPVFLGDAFASTAPQGGLALNAAAWLTAMLKAWLLARARGFKATPWQAGWAAAALGFIHLFPSMIALKAARPADFYWAGCWAAAALAAAAPRPRKIAGVLTAAVMLHLAASGFVFSVPFQERFLTPPFLALAVLLPWPRLSWVPAAAAILCSPLRPFLARSLGTMDGLGVLLVATAYGLLGLGILTDLRSASKRSGDPPPCRSPSGASRPP